MKVNDRHEFPEEFDASPYLSDEADKSEPWIYQLHGVLIHSGDFNAGHYYAFLKPTKDGHWYKFDDDRVTRATLKETLEENYGGEYPNATNGLGQRQPFMRGYSTKRSMNAYMLVYIRKSRVDDVLLEVKESDIPPHLERRLNEEKAELERKRKEREEAHLYLTVHVISDKTFQNHQTFDMANWEVNPNDPAAPKAYRVLKATKVSEFAQTIADENGLPVDDVRFWVMVNRQNKTVRPDQPLRDGSMTLDDAWNRLGSKGGQFRLWAEFGQPTGEDGKAGWPEATPTSVPILVFIKYFDVKAQSLSGVGHIYVKKHARVSDMAPQIIDLMKWEPGANFTLFEEIKNSMIEPMKPKQTFQQSEIQDGDIICVQLTIPESEQGSILYTDARQYYDYLLNRVPVAFMPRTAESEGGEFTLTLSKKMTYDQFSMKVGEHLGVDPTFIRYATVNATTGKPKTWVKRTVNQNLLQILTSQYSYGYTNHRSDALYYEVLDTSLSEYETKKIMKITWLSDGISKEVSANHRLSINYR